MRRKKGRKTTARASAPEANKLIAKSHRWQKTAIAAAAIALVGLSASSAWALSLGRITVQSALGEPLRAEIDVLDINAEEAATLKAGVASPEAFAAAGLEYSSAMSSLKATLQRRADGRAYLKLVSDKAVVDPFVDMIVEASWSSGRILRDYTMLFDPPTLKKSAAEAPTLAQTTAPQPPAVASASVAATPALAPTASVVAPPVRATAQPAKPAVSGSTAPAPKLMAPAVVSDGTSQVTVKSGDTAGKIAAAVRHEGVSLDQMLVALLRSNPDAFIKNNINRIRAGAVMNVPSKEQAQSVSANEATQLVIAQSKDFNEFRRNLAAHTPSAAPEAASRKASGTVETKVEDKKAATPTPDKLTLSKGAVQPKGNEAQIAKDRAAKEAASRNVELSKNISDLQKLGAASTPTAPTSTAASAKPATSAPTITAAAPVVTASAAVSAPATKAASSVPAAVASSAPASAPPAAKPSEPASVAAPKPPVVVAPQPVYEEPGFLDELLENPWLPYGAGGLLALLGGVAVWRVRQRRNKQSHMDSSFLESRLQPDSFFGASGGQRVDTANESGVSGSSMVYSASQLDAADDVDPVAEADVYLAYGRDVQAEEILREALRTNPSRVAVYTKLLEIYAKRRDTKNYEAIATQAYALTGANNPDWNRICEMGLGIDPTNPLYQPGGAPSPVATQPLAPTGTSGFGSTVPQSAHAELAPPASGMDLDLDLDFSLDDPMPSSAQVPLTETPASPISEATAKLPPLDSNAPMDMDFDLSEEPAAAAPPMIELPPSLPEPSPVPEVPAGLDGISLELDDDSASSAPPKFGATEPMSVEPVPPSGALASNEGMLEFDLGSLSLDLDSSTPAHTDTPTAAPSNAEDPLETKLALAEEFVSIGDEDGARALIEEVLAEATGATREKAQRALSQLS